MSSQASSSGSPVKCHQKHPEATTSCQPVSGLVFKLAQQQLIVVHDVLVYALSNQNTFYQNSLSSCKMYWCLFMSKHTGINYAYALSIEESLRLLDVSGIDVEGSCMTHMLKYIRTCLAHSLSKQTKDISRLNRVDWAPAERRDFLRAWNTMAKPTLLGKANEICLNSGSKDVETVSFLDVCWPSSEESKRMNRRGFSSLEVSGFQFTWAARYLLCAQPICDIHATMDQKEELADCATM